jgi:hypothetical protein
LSKAYYYIVYIDNATRFTCIFFLKSKSASAVLPVFKEYMVWVDAQGFHIKRFWCDNRIGEFDNDEFWNLLALSGIAFEPAPPFTQHKNGIAERYIQTINGKARSMMLDSHMPHRFWAEAVNIATYLHSISLTKTLVKSQSPHQALYGRRPPIAYLRHFGCLVYKHIPKEQRTDKDWGPHSLPCMFVGYVANTTNIWQIYDFSTRTVSRASNVVFVEGVNAYDSSGQASGPNEDKLKAIFECFPPDIEESEDISPLFAEELDTLIKSMLIHIIFFDLICTFAIMIYTLFSIYGAWRGECLIRPG